MIPHAVPRHDASVRRPNGWNLLQAAISMHRRLRELAVACFLESDLSLQLIELLPRSSEHRRNRRPFATEPAVRIASSHPNLPYPLRERLDSQEPTVERLVPFCQHLGLS
jgi:hypothetical protein